MGDDGNEEASHSTWEQEADDRSRGSSESQPDGSSSRGSSSGNKKQNSRGTGKQTQSRMQSRTKPAVAEKQDMAEQLTYQEAHAAVAPKEKKAREEKQKRTCLDAVVAMEQAEEDAVNKMMAEARRSSERAR